MAYCEDKKLGVCGNYAEAMAKKRNGKNCQQFHKGIMGTVITSKTLAIAKIGRLAIAKIKRFAIAKIKTLAIAKIKRFAIANKFHRGNELCQKNIF